MLAHSRPHALAPQVLRLSTALAGGQRRALGGPPASAKLMDRFTESGLGKQDGTVIAHDALDP